MKLTYGSYACNQRTFEQFLQLEDRAATTFAPFVANPFHHTNTTAITDWALRRPGARLHLMQRYSTAYWKALVGVAAGWLPPPPPLPPPAPAATEEGALGAASTSTATPASTLNERLLSDAAPPSREAVAAAVKAQRAAGLRVVAPLVSKHFDFLESLMEKNGAATDTFWAALPAALSSPHVTVLFGSAPVGPTTVNRMRKYAGGRLPTVRFGSTETCLQVCGTPLSLSEEQRLAAFRRGWEHVNAKHEASAGYYIGRGHAPHTEVKVVRSVTRGAPGYLEAVPEGESGLLVTRGANLMSGYVGNDAATAEALHRNLKSGDDQQQQQQQHPWYVNLGDVCFALTNPDDGGQDIYWQSRESSLLIRGGANYSYDQINDELTRFVAKEFGLASSDFALAVIGLRLRSEHEDDCCVTVQLPESYMMGAGGGDAKEQGWDPSPP